MALTTDFLFRVKAIESGSPDLSVLKDTLDYMKNLIWASGTGASQADVLWHDQRTLTASATEDLDLAGSLTGVLAGTTLTYVELKGLIIFAAATNTNDVQLTRPASNGVPLFLAASDGLAVGAGWSVRVAQPRRRWSHRHCRYWRSPHAHQLGGRHVRRVRRSYHRSQRISTGDTINNKRHGNETWKIQEALCGGVCPVWCF